MSISEEYNFLLQILLGIILATGGWLIPNLGKNLYVYFKIKKPVRDFFEKYFKEEKEGLLILVPPADVDKLLPGTQIFDFLGIMELHNMFLEMGIKTKIVRSNSIDERDLKHNFISIGGPIPNNKTNILLSQDEIVYKFGETKKTDHTIISKKNPKFKIESKKTEEGTIERDFAILTKMQNPYDKNKDVIIACGCFGWGTQAAIRILMNKDNLSKLMEFSQHFQVICTCGIDNDKIALNPYILDYCSPKSLRKKTLIKLYE